MHFSGKPADLLKRLEQIKDLISVTLIVLVGLSMPVWLSSRNYPLAPVFQGIPSLPAPWDYLPFAAMLLLPALILFRSRIRILFITLFILFFLLVLADQNRLQPYFLQLLFMLLAVGMADLTRPVSAQTALRTIGIVLFGTYLWAGIQKINPHFLDTLWRLAESSLTNSTGRESWPNAMKYLVLGLPLTEVALAFGLLWPTTRKLAVILLVMMHVGIAVVLSPWFLGWNYIVIPWNLALAVINVLVFWNNTDRLKDFFKLLQTPIHGAAILIFVILPSLNLIGLWDHYLSSSLYSYKVPFTKIYVEGPLLSELPPSIIQYTDQDEQGSFIEVTWWAMGEMNIAPYPEHRVNKQVRDYLCGFSSGDTCRAKIVYYWY
jgi:hypothetical protein